MGRYVTTKGDIKQAKNEWKSSFKKKKKRMREGLTINYHKLDPTNSTVLKMFKLQVTTIFMI